MLRKRLTVHGWVASSFVVVAVLLPAVPAQAAGGTATTAFTNPAANAAVCGTAPVDVTATQGANGAITATDITVDGTSLPGYPDTSGASTYSTSWDTTAVADGPHTLAATASDSGGTGPTTSESVTVVNTAPVTAPSANAALTGESVTVTTRDAANGVSITGVQATIGATSAFLGHSGAFYTGSLSISGVTGAQSITVTATYAGGCTGTTAVPVTVSHPPVLTINAPGSGATVAGHAVGVTATATANGGRSVTAVDFYLDQQDGAHLLGTDTAGPSYSVTWDTLGGPTGVTANGAHTLIYVATDDQGATKTLTRAVTVTNTPPDVTITSPGAGSVSGVVNVAATANAHSGTTIASVTFFDNGTQIGSPDLSSPYQVSWDTTGKNGSHNLTATAVDSNGLSTTSAPVTVTVGNGPAVAITAPTAGSQVVGAGVTISVTAAPDAGSSSVSNPTVTLDGNPLGTATPVGGNTYHLTWNTTTVADGSHTLVASTTDNNGNPGTSSGVSVMVANPPTVTISGPAPAPATLTGDASVTGTATPANGSSIPAHNVVVTLDPAGSATSLGSAVLSGTSYALTWHTGTASNGGHTLEVVATDNRGNASTPVTENVVVANPPTVAMVAPSGTLSGTTASVSATASAPSGSSIVSVAFYYDVAGDPAHLIGTDSTGPSPYSVTWNTVGQNGAHTLYAVATESVPGSSNVSKTSAGQSVTVGNAPTGSITAPAANAAVAGTAVPITVAATPDAGATITSVTVHDGASTIGTATTSPYTVTWNTVGLTNGSHSLTAKITDSTGAIGTTAAVTVYVANAPTVAVSAPSGPVSGPATVGATASAPSGSTIASVTFYYDTPGDPAHLIGTDSTGPSPYSVTWNTVGHNGAHTLYAVATEHVPGSADVSTTSAGVAYVVANAPTGAIAQPTSGATVNGVAVAVDVTATSDPGTTVGQVEVFLDGSSPTSSLGTATLVSGTSASGTWELGWNTIGYNGTHTLTAVVTDAGDPGSVTTAPITVHVVNPTAATISSPKDGATVEGVALPIKVIAQADSGQKANSVTSVTVLIDGTPLGDAVPTAQKNTWTIPWDTTGHNGPHVITAHVTDAVGAAGDSAPVSVTVANGAPSLTVSGVSDGSTVGRTSLPLTISAAADPKSGQSLQSVVADVDGTALAVTATGQAGHYVATWDTTHLLGQHILTVTATDTAGMGTTRTVHVLVAAPDVMTFTPPTSVPYRGWLTLQARLRLADGAPLAGRAVTFTRRLGSNGAWTPVGTATTTADGTAALLVRVGPSARYAASFAGEPGAAALTTVAVDDTRVAPLLSVRLPRQVAKGGRADGYVTVTTPRAVTLTLIVRQGRHQIVVGRVNVRPGHGAPFHLTFTRVGDWVVYVTSGAGPTLAPASSNRVTVHVR